MQIFSETIEIDAPDHLVYEVIADLPHYREWNPWIYHAEGQATPGGRVVVKMRMLGKERCFDHRVLSTQPPHTFHWCDVGWFTALAYGDRLRKIERIADDKCRYQVDLRIKGVAEHLTRWLLGNALAQGMRQETFALKARAENLYRTR